MTPNIGNIIRFTINRAQHNLTPSNLHHSNVLCGSITHIHKNSVEVKALDIWGDKKVKYIKIDKKDVIAIL